ncbi:Fe-S protein [Microbacterium sp. 179-B 1A2 NHS]|uniref:Fe-S protein n=1 Tax=Microbacterium sp. 179-B 1A2 NHS TaxID=3142383 RepID=UPI00399EEC11
METLRSIVVLIHLVGFAAIFGAWLVEALGRRRITRLMHWGLGVALLAGLVLSAPWGLSHDLNYTKIGIKLVVLVIIGGLLGAGAARGRKAGAVPAGIFWSVGALTLLNAGLAVIWR